MRKLNDPTATSFRVSQIAVRGGVNSHWVEKSEILQGGFFYWMKGT